FVIANLRFANPPEDSHSALPRWLFFRSINAHLRSFLILLSIALVAWGLRQASAILVRALVEERSREEQERAFGREHPSLQQQHARREQVHAMASERPKEVASLLSGWIAGEKRS